jgi:nicotinamidase-related amidase
MRTALVIIDPQNCFMDLPGAPLPVTGATDDMDRLTQLILRNCGVFEQIFISLDTHPLDHISHANRWIDAGGSHPDPFTVISYEDCLTGKWRAANEDDWWWQLEYIRRLKRPHVIWPVHGQMPTWEWGVYDPLDLGLIGENVMCVEKGMHRDVEQFGIFGAEVPFPDAPETDINHALIAEIDSYDRVIFAGEASSHCVMDSVKQFLEHMPSQDPTKVVLLKDCMSPVTGFEQLAADWLGKMDAVGVRVTTSTGYIAVQRASEKP